MERTDNDEEEDLDDVGDFSNEITNSAIRAWIASMEEVDIDDFDADIEADNFTELDEENNNIADEEIEKGNSDEDIVRDAEEVIERVRHRKFKNSKSNTHIHAEVMENPSLLDGSDLSKLASYYFRLCQNDIFDNEQKWDFSRGGTNHIRTSTQRRIYDTCFC